MNILIVSASDPFRNSGRVALDLHRGFSKEAGFTVRLLSRYSRQKEEGIVSYHNKPGYYFRKMLLAAEDILKGKGIVPDPDYYFQDPESDRKYYSTKNLLKKAGFKPDVILVLFMVKFVNFKNLAEMQSETGARIILYPMDMALYTGGCHYSWQCLGYTEECGKCPALYSHDSHDQSNKNIVYKKQQSLNTKFTILAGNKQMYRQIKASSLFRKHEIIPDMYPDTDKSIFHRREKNSCRLRFGIDPQKFVFFFGSVGLDEKRKGMKVFADALQLLQQRLVVNGVDTSNILLLVAGGNFEAMKLPFEVNYVGHLSNPSELAMAYGASNYFVCPSLEDAGPTMVLQSMFCCVPVIGFDLGFINEFINDYNNGFVAENKTAEALSISLNMAVQSTTEEQQLMQNNLSQLTQSLSASTLGEKLAKLITSA